MSGSLAMMKNNTRSLEFILFNINLTTKRRKTDVVLVFKRIVQIISFFNLTINSNGSITLYLTVKSLIFVYHIFVCSIEKNKLFKDTVLVT